MTEEDVIVIKKDVAPDSMMRHAVEQFTILFLVLLVELEGMVEEDKDTIRGNLVELVEHQELQEDALIMVAQEIQDRLVDLVVVGDLLEHQCPVMDDPFQVVVQEEESLDRITL